MNFITHIMISETLYNYFSKDIPLEKGAFRYGNIKPDLTSKCLQNPHTLENCMFLVCSYSSRLTDQNLSLKEFSAELGVICHYVCDFFCYYHYDNSMHKKLFRHFIYELRLQLYLTRMLLAGKIIIKPARTNRPVGIASLVMELRREYAAEEKTLHNDIEYAFHAAARVCESILSRRGTAVSAMDHPA